MVHNIIKFTIYKKEKLIQFRRDVVLFSYLLNIKNILKLIYVYLSFVCLMIAENICIL